MQDLNNYRLTNMFQGYTGRWAYVVYSVINGQRSEFTSPTPKGKEKNALNISFNCAEGTNYADLTGTEWERVFLWKL